MPPFRITEKHLLQIPALQDFAQLGHEHLSSEKALVEHQQRVA